MLDPDKTVIGDPVPLILRRWLQTWRPCFTAPSWEHVLVLVMGAVLATGKRTVTSCLRVTGRAEASNFASHHQILNRARWSSRAVAKQLLGTVVDRLVPDGPVVIGMDDIIERRWGRRISARGIYRDPVRSSHGHFVKASGLRWLSFMVLTPVSWTSLIKALPVLTLLAPSERSNRGRGCRHKLLTDWARQGALQLSRWLPDRQIIFIGDSSFAVHELAHAIVRRATLISPLRLDANLFAPPAKRTSRTMGRPAQKGSALPKLKSLLSNPATRWTRIAVSAWYGHVSGKALDITSGVALWYRPGTRCCRSDGSWFVTPTPGVIHKPSSAPTSPSSRLTSSPCTSAGGRSRSRSPKRALIWASRRSANGRTKLSLEPRRRFSDSTALSRCGLVIFSLFLKHALRCLVSKNEPDIQ